MPREKACLFKKNDKQKEQVIVDYEKLCVLIKFKHFSEFMQYLMRICWALN